MILKSCPLAWTADEVEVVDYLIPLLKGLAFAYYLDLTVGYSLSHSILPSTVTRAESSASQSQDFHQNICSIVPKQQDRT
jgi:hypothetical protein